MKIFFECFNFIFFLKDRALKTRFPGSFLAPKAPEKNRGILRSQGGGNPRVGGKYRAAEGG